MNGGKVMTEKEIKIVRNCMETHLNFASQAALSDKQREFYRGAAAAINDLLCHLGCGNAVMNLALRLQTGDDQIEELRWCFDNESNDPESQEWRENLTEAEADLIEQWDMRIETQIGKLCSDILELEKQKRD